MDEKENKYVFDINELAEKEDDDKKLERRKKHKKGRVTAWISLILIVLLIAGGAAFGISMLVKSNTSSASAVSESVITESDEVKEVISNMIGDEEEVVVTPPDEMVEEPTEEELFEEAVRNYVTGMTLEDQVAGIFIVTPEELTGVSTVTRAGDGTKTALEKYAVGGIVYSSQNMTSADQFKTVIENTVSYARYPLFLAVDEELGNSAFSKAMKVTETMTAKEIGDNGDTSVAYLEEEKIAKYMSEYGLNLNLGVVAEVITSEDSYMADRCFSDNLELTEGLVSKVIAALNEYGVDSAVKFFPGQSSATQDTSSGLASTERTKEEMDATELASFKSAIENGADMVVVSHMSAPNLTGDDTQCSQSKYVMTDLLRVEMGFDDLIIVTDSLSKPAISNYLDSSDACITAIKAGADMVMCPEDFEGAYEAVLEAVNKGVIAKERIEDSLVRIYKCKFKGMTSDEVTTLCTLSETQTE